MTYECPKVERVHYNLVEHSLNDTRMIVVITFNPIFI